MGSLHETSPPPPRAPDDTWGGTRSSRRDALLGETKTLLPGRRELLFPTPPQRQHRWHRRASGLLGSPAALDLRERPHRVARGGPFSCTQRLERRVLSSTVVRGPQCTRTRRTE